MFHVYVLHSEKDAGLYIGYTTNIKNRLNEHNEGSVISTKARRPLHLIFLETYLNKADAVRRERYLKTAIGKKMLKSMLRTTLGENVFKAVPHSVQRTTIGDTNSYLPE